MSTQCMGGAVPAMAAQRLDACRLGLDLAKTCGGGRRHAAPRCLRETPQSQRRSDLHHSRTRGTPRTLAAAAAPAAPSQTSAAAPALAPELAELCGGLPIADVLPDVLRSLRDAPSLVLQADPGAGKTTIVPLALLTDQPPWLPAAGKIVVRARRASTWACNTGRAGRAQAEKVWFLCEDVGSMCRRHGCKF